MIEEQIEEVKVKNEKTLIRRIVALGIDFIVLGIIGFILGLIFKSFLALTGVHGILIGWILSSIYFTLGNSKPLSGQTIGKALMMLKVVDSKGEYLNLKTAALRSLSFTSPYFLLEYIVIWSFFPNILNQVLGIIYISYYLGLAYFLFVDTKSRQTIHDLFLQSVVVKVSQLSSVSVSGLKRKKLFGFVGLISIIIISLYIFTTKVNDSTIFSELAEANQEVLINIGSEIIEMDNILYLESAKIIITIESKVGVKIVVWTKKDFDEFDYEKMGSDIINVLKGKTFNINRLDYTEIIINYGYDIGIADSKKSKNWKIDNK